MAPTLSRVQRALAGARPSVYWLEDPARPDPHDDLPASGAPLATVDLVVVGGGYLGLWTALEAVTRQPGRPVLLLEADRCGGAASGRNGGFCEASLTHGFGNGMSRWPEEMPTLLRLGHENLREIRDTVTRLGIDCDPVPSGTLEVATAPHHLDALADDAAGMQRLGEPVELLDTAETRSRVSSPTYLGALRNPGAMLVEPARLAWGLRQACLDAGVRIAEGLPVTGIDRDGAGVEVHTARGRVRARRAVLATNAFPSLLRRLRLMTVPVYDYALMTEPLSSAQRAAIGWAGREGVGDGGNQFHYYRTSRDGRILWGGYDAIYHYGSRIDPALEQRQTTFETLAANFLTTFPQLEDVRFSHAWGGVIDTCTRFTAFYGTAMAGRVGYAAGFTGLGVAATRFAALVLLDLLSGRQTERTTLRMVRERPLPFPPEPLRAAGIWATRRSLAAADDSGGRENLWLRALDRLGMGFDS